MEQIEAIKLVTSPDIERALAEKIRSIELRATTEPATDTVASVFGLIVCCIGLR